MTLDATERECAAHAIAPRVSLAEIEAAIGEVHHLNAYEAAVATGGPNPDEQLKVLSLCLVVMRNGFTVIGKSAPASPKNFDAELGRKLAYEDAVRQLWPLMGFALRERLADARRANQEQLG